MGIVYSESLIYAMFLGNSWGVDQVTGTACMGCGPQEEFYACSDVAIEMNGSSNPSTLLTAPSMPAPVPTALTKLLTTKAPATVPRVSVTHTLTVSNILSIMCC